MDGQPEVQADAPTDARPGVQPRKRGRPTAEERRAREAEILSNVLCVFLLSGYGASTVDELAAAAQVTKRTLYAYYGDKAGLFAAMVTQLAATVSLDATSDDDTLEVLAARIVSRVHSDERVATFGNRPECREDGQLRANYGGDRQPPISRHRGSGAAWSAARVSRRG